MRQKLILFTLLLLVPLAWADKPHAGRGYLGVSLHFTESIEKDGVPVSEGVGVFLASVVPDGPADQAGLRPDDRVVAIDGKRIATLMELKHAMLNTRKGDAVAVTVERGDREQTYTVTLGEFPKKRTNVERFGLRMESLEDRAFVGIESQPVSDQLAEYFGVEGGILVTRVVEGSPADRAGMEAGDVIVAWGDTPLRQVHDVHEMIARSKPGDEVELAVSRRGIESRTFVTLDAASDHMQDVDFPAKLRIKDDKKRFKVKIKEQKSSER